MAGVIVPSPYSAIEGIKVYAPQMDRAVIPLTVVILAVLFIIQRKGSTSLVLFGAARADQGK
jgi:KUP system potassium uptake protein